MRKPAKPSLDTLGDIFRFAVRRFRAARLAYGHGTTNAVDEAAFLTHVQGPVAAWVQATNPELFTDAVHSDYSGTRLRGWITFQQLLPTIERHLADGSWPSKRGAELPLPTFTPRSIPTPCNK